MKKSIIVVFLLISRLSFAQILDDSTKMVYGPHTTQYLYEENIKLNDLYFTSVDTSLINIHRYTTTELSEYQLQDLGAIGTATRSIYYTPPSIIGARSGFYVYEPFFKPPEDFRYYDTKSPYSRIGAAIGGNGRSRVDVGFNRSDSSNFNIGLDYKRLVADKQTNSIGKHDRLADSEGYDIYMLYFTPNRKYLALTNYSRNKNVVVDQGGINTSDDYFDEDASVFLNDAKSEYLRKNFHFYHHLNLDSTIQIYQSFDRSYASSKFKIENLSISDIVYFDPDSIVNISNDSTSESNLFRTTTLETGVKGTLGKLFYMGYYKIRGYDFEYGWADLDILNFNTLKFNTQKPKTKGIEHYVGGVVRVQLNRKYSLTGKLDFNLNGNQRLSGDLLASNFDVHLVMQQYSPSLMERAYLGNHDFWINDFKNIKTIQVDGGYTQKFGRSFIRPKMNFTTITDYIYFDTEARPAQTDGTTTILRPGLNFGINFFNHFHIAGNAEYALVSGANTDALPIPDLMLNVNLFYHRMLFDDNLELQVGLDAHWKSNYYAPDYRVSTHQFFIQNEFLIPAFPVVDSYLNIKMGRAYVFAKMNNLVQVATTLGYSDIGYFAGPNYIGKRPLFDFGFYWMFFD
ncbi:MAG: putative porin [Bacteroidota bacterium]